MDLEEAKKIGAEKTLEYLNEFFSKHNNSNEVEIAKLIEDICKDEEFMLEIFKIIFPKNDIKDINIAIKEIEKIEEKIIKEMNEETGDDKRKTSIL